MSEDRRAAGRRRTNGVSRTRRYTLFLLIATFMLLLTHPGTGSVSRAVAVPTPIPIGWTAHTSDRLGIAIWLPASWHIYTHTMHGRYAGLDPILLASFEIEFEAVGHDIGIPSGGAAMLVAFEGNDRPPGQSLADYALTHLVSPYYRLTGRTITLGRIPAVEMVGESGHIYVFGRGPNVYSAFIFAANDPHLTTLVDHILSTLSPLRDGPVPTPKGIRALPEAEGEFVALSEGPPGLEYPWGGPAMKLPWDRDATHRYTGGPHNWTMRWDCYLASVDDACGLDFGMPQGTEILAVADGTVQWGYTPGTVGNYVILDHGGGWSTRYLHLYQVDPSLSWNQTVSQGRVLGLSGTAGTGPHLHLEIRYNGTIPAAWHGTPIDGYLPRMLVSAIDESKGWNYQGTLTRGTESTTIVIYCGAQTIKWIGSDGTIVAGDGQPVVSTNQRHTGQPSPTPTSTCTPTPTATPARAPDVSIDKTLVAADPTLHRHITFTLAVANIGEQVASRVVVTDILPAEVLTPTFTSTLALTPTGILSYVWYVQALEAGEGGIITLTGWVSPGLSSTSAFCNWASISDPEDTSPANNTDTAIVDPLKAYLPLTLRNDMTSIPTPTPTATPPTCVEGIANGGFESDSDWEIPGPDAGIYPADYSTSQAHDGERSMRVGIIDHDDDIPSWSSARQLLTIPADVTSATLRFWLYALTEEPPLTLPSRTTLLWEDLQLVRILTEDGQFLEPLLRQRVDAPQWTSHQFDLTAHAGRTIKVYFGVVNDGQNGVTGMYIDNVSLQLCTTAPPH